MNIQSSIFNMKCVIFSHIKDPQDVIGDIFTGEHHENVLHQTLEEVLSSSSCYSTCSGVFPWLLLHVHLFQLFSSSGCCINKFFVQE